MTVVTPDFMRGEVLQQQLRCREPGVDPDLFFATQTDGFGLVARAKAICRPCPVRERCLEVALEFGEHLQGVWGGTTQRERRRILRRRQQQQT